MKIEKRKDQSYVGTINLNDPKDKETLDDLTEMIYVINRDDPKVRRAPLRKLVLKRYNTDTEVSRLHGSKVDVYVKFMD